MKATTVFEDHVPPAAVRYCYHLQERYPFTLRVTKPRQSKLGDFRAQVSRALPRQVQYTITVNENLNRPAFLITYLHEVAHLLVHHASGRRRIEPHGMAWKKAFQEVMQPVLTETVFPPSVLLPLRDYLADPAASTSAHPALTHALRLLDAPPTDHQLLLEVPEGVAFRFLKKEYIRGMKRRTRVVCTEKGTGLKVSIWAHVWVEKI